MIQEEGSAKTFNAGGDFGMEKLGKQNQLNETMTISNSERDAYESKIHNIGGGN